MTLENSVLTSTAGKRRLEADATMTLSRETLDRIRLAETTPDKEMSPDPETRVAT